MHYASDAFWNAYNKLPPEIQELADRCFALLKENPRHPSLHFKKLEGTTWWSVRVGSHYRALAKQVGADMQWRWIGTHAEYDRRKRNP